MIAIHRADQDSMADAVQEAGRIPQQRQKHILPTPRPPQALTVGSASYCPHTQRNRRVMHLVTSLVAACRERVAIGLATCGSDHRSRAKCAKD